MNNIAEKYIRKSSLPLIFCPGCGDGIVLGSFLRAVESLGIKDDMALVSGIGCSSWAPVYVDTDVMHTLHGRAIPCAVGLKVARPDKKIIVFTGDGDCVGIGGNHLIHAARRNIDITVIMMTNFIYGMTGGQKAPTTPFGAETKTSPLGNEERPFDVHKLVVGAGGTFFARWTAAHPLQMQKAIEAAVCHNGFAMVEVLSQCPTQAGRTLYNTKEPSVMLEWLKEHTVTVSDKKPADPADSRIKIGLLHCENQPEFTETLASKRGMAQQ